MMTEPSKKETTVKTAQLSITFVSTFGHSDPVRYLFANGEVANAALTDIHDAAKAYQDRANDRERMFRFDHLTGSASVDVSQIGSIAVDDALGPNSGAVDAWNQGICEMKARAELAGERVMEAGKVA